MTGLEIVMTIVDLSVPLAALIISMEARVYVRKNDNNEREQKWRDAKDNDFNALVDRVSVMERGFTADNNERWMMLGVWRDSTETQVSDLRRYVSMSLNVLQSILSAVEGGMAKDMTRDKDKIAKFREESKL